MLGKRCLPGELLLSVISGRSPAVKAGQNLTSDASDAPVLSQLGTHDTRGGSKGWLSAHQISLRVQERQLLWRVSGRCNTTAKIR